MNIRNTNDLLNLYFECPSLEIKYTISILSAIFDLFEIFDFNQIWRTFIVCAVMKRRDAQKITVNVYFRKLFVKNIYELNIQ